MNEDFDESILDNEKEFKKRFKKIERPDFLNSIIAKSLREAKNRRQGDKDLINADMIKNEES